MILNQTHVFPITVDFDLLDAGGVVHHPSYLVLAERARTAALNLAGYPLAELWNDGYALALVENTSRYFRPAGIGLKLIILTRGKEVSATRLWITQDILPESLYPGPIREAFVDNPPPLPPKAALHSIEMTLATVTLSPLKATRMPLRLKQALKLPE